MKYLRMAINEKPNTSWISTVFWGTAGLSVTAVFVTLIIPEPYRQSLRLPALPKLPEVLIERATDPVIVNAIAQAVIPATISAAVTIGIHRSRESVESQQLQLRQRHSEAEIFYGEFEQHMQNQSYALASSRALLAFTAYHTCYMQQPSLLLEQRLNDLQYQRALALVHMGRYQLPTSQTVTSESSSSVLSSSEVSLLSDAENAFIILNDLIIHDDKHFDALNLRGLIYLLEESWEQAEQDFNRSLTIYPNQNMVYIMIQYARSKLKIEDISFCHEIIKYSFLNEKINIFSPMLIEIFALSHTRIGNITHAIAFYQLAIASWSRNLMYKDKIAIFYREELQLLNILITQLQETELVELPKLIPDADTTRLSVGDIRRRIEHIQTRLTGSYAIPLLTYTPMPPVSSSLSQTILPPPKVSDVPTSASASSLSSSSSNSHHNP